MRPIKICKARWMSWGQVLMPTSKIAIILTKNPRYPRYLINLCPSTTTKLEIIGRMRALIVIGTWRRMPRSHRVSWGYSARWKKTWSTYLRTHSVSMTRTARSRASKPRRLTRAHPQGDSLSKSSEMASSAPSAKQTQSRAACMSC